jgi:hypothetical protein
MTLVVEPVPVSQVPQVIPVALPFIESGLEHTDSVTAEQAKVYLSEGRWVLLVASNEHNVVQGAYVLSIVNDPNHRVATIVSAGGAGLASQEAFDQVCEIAKKFGATKIQVLAREAAARLYKRAGLEDKAMLMEKMLWAA